VRSQEAADMMEECIGHAKDAVQSVFTYGHLQGTAGGFVGTVLRAEAAHRQEELLVYQGVQGLYRLSNSYDDLFRALGRCVAAPLEFLDPHLHRPQGNQGGGRVPGNLRGPEGRINVPVRVPAADRGMQRGQANPPRRSGSSVRVPGPAHGGRGAGWGVRYARAAVQAVRLEPHVVWEQDPTGFVRIYRV
jgi:hypothetical protein